MTWFDDGGNKPPHEPSLEEAQRFTRRQRTWTARGWRYLPLKPVPPCPHCGQPTTPGHPICDQCLRDEAKEAASHQTKGAQ